MSKSSTPVKDGLPQVIKHEHLLDTVNGMNALNTRLAELLNRITGHPSEENPKDDEFKYVCLSESFDEAACRLREIKESCLVLIHDIEASLY